MNKPVLSGIKLTALLFQICFLSILRASPQSMQPTLLARPVTAEVERGGSGELLLEAVPSNGLEVKFTFGQQPSHGSLGEVLRKSPNAVVVTYTNNGDKEKSDSFMFRIKAPGKTWATCQALISIKDPPDSLQVTPSLLDFGKVGLGEAPSKKLLLKNSLDSEVSGTLLLPSPWRIDGDGRYHLLIGESAEFTVYYEPHEVGQSMATVSLLPSGKGPKITLQGESIVPFGFSPRMTELNSGTTSTEVVVENYLNHPIMVKVSTDDLVSVIPLISLQPKAIRKVHLKSLRQSSMGTSSTVRFAYGDYVSDLSVKILPSALLTNKASVAPADTWEHNPRMMGGATPKPARVTVVKLPTNTVNQDTIKIGAGLPQISTQPILLPEDTQETLRPLMVSEIAYFLTPGWLGWHLTLQWHYDNAPPKEFLIEERLPADKASKQSGAVSGMEYRKIKPHWVRSGGNGVWSASVPPPPSGFRFLRIAPVLEGKETIIWASFQMQMPSNQLIWERYRGPLALILFVILVIMFLRIRGRK